MDSGKESRLSAASWPRASCLTGVTGKQDSVMKKRRWILGDGRTWKSLILNCSYGMRIGQLDFHWNRRQNISKDCVLKWDTHIHKADENPLWEWQLRKWWWHLVSPPNTTPLLLLVAGSLHNFSLFLFLFLPSACSLLSTFLSVISLGKYKITEGVFNSGREIGISHTSNLALNYPFGQGFFAEK